MPTYQYFPASHEEKIKTLLLDANITSHLDTIVKRGKNFTNPVVQRRMRHLVERLDGGVLVLAGLGASESVMRHGGMQSIVNYERRISNARALLDNGPAGVRAWLDDETRKIEAAEPERAKAEVDAYDFEIVRENLIIPSYAIILMSYRLYLENDSPEASFRILSTFAEELFGRGSREVMLGALLLVGNPQGRSMALNIMKLQKEKDFETTRNLLWNTSFDLTYSRVAVMSSLPELEGRFIQPCVFVTDDKHLGAFLRLIDPRGAIVHPSGGGVTGDHAEMSHLIREDVYRSFARIVSEQNSRTMEERLSRQEISRVRRYKAKKYIADLEDWLLSRGSK